MGFLSPNYAEMVELVDTLSWGGSEQSLWGFESLFLHQTPLVILTEFFVVKKQWLKGIYLIQSIDRMNFYLKTKGYLLLNKIINKEYLYWN